MKKALTILLALVMLGICCTGCASESSSSGSSPSPSASPESKGASEASSGSPPPSDSAKTGNISIAGSTALQPLLTQAVHSFKSETEFIGAITVNGGGSGQGLLDVAAGAVDIGSSDISPAQAGQEETGLVDHQVAVVLVAVAVSPDVAANLTEISTADLKGIFTGAITDWTEVAGWKGASLPIAVYYHRGGSGTRVIFETYGIMTPLGNEYLSALSGFTEIQSAVNLEKALNVDKGAIGYAAYPYCSGLSLLKIDGVEPNYENVYSGKYKLWACGHLYTKGEPSGAVKSFIEFLQSSDFEQTITENGYGLISEMKVSR